MKRGAPVLLDKHILAAELVASSAPRRMPARKAAAA
jgi:hypothetical protein